MHRKRILARSVLSHLAISLVAFQFGVMYGDTVVSCHCSTNRYFDSHDRSNHPSEQQPRRSLEPSEFLKQFDTGIPWQDASKEVMLLWNGHGGATTTVDDCDTVKVLYSNSNDSARTCYAVVPFVADVRHVHTFQRRRSNNQWKSSHKFSNPKTTLQPKPVHSKDANLMLGHYLSHLHDALEQLRPLATKVSQSGVLLDTVVLLVCNVGHAELLLNFYCAAQSVGVDLGDFLVVAIDESIVELSQSLGLAVFYHKPLLEHIPKQSAEYGSLNYAQVMMSKIYCVHMISHLGIDFIFQDVDMVPYRSEYLQVFASTIKDNDMVFQYDHSTESIYLPYSANSGFYYAKSNPRTKYFFEALLKSGEMILRSKSHQAVIATLLSEHASLFGLKVKTLYDQSNDFPVGYHFHRDRTYMKDLIQGKRQPYVFHMNWNNDKATKRRFNEQLGDWHILSQCTTGETGGTSLSADCCVEHPTPVCHFRDKPSKIPCPESPLLEDDTSFW